MASNWMAGGKRDCKGTPEQECVFSIIGGKATPKAGQTHCGICDPVALNALLSSQGGRAQLKKRLKSMPVSSRHKALLLIPNETLEHDALRKVAASDDPPTAQRKRQKKQDGASGRAEKPKAEAKKEPTSKGTDYKLAQGISDGPPATNGNIQSKTRGKPSTTIQKTKAPKAKAAAKNLKKIKRQKEKKKDTARPGEISSALLIKKMWCDEIFDNNKTWEVRGEACHKREKICIAQSLSGRLVGEATIVNCLKIGLQREKGNIEPWSDEKDYMWDRLNRAKHCIRSPKIVKYKKIYAWVLEGAKRYKRPVPYKHKKGQIKWITLSATEREAAKKEADKDKERPHGDIVPNIRLALAPALVPPKEEAPWSTTGQAFRNPADFFKEDQEAKEEGPSDSRDGQEDTSSFLPLQRGK